MRMSELIYDPDRLLPGEHRLMLPGPSGSIEAILHLPETPPHALLLICHPHSLMGGSLDNKVVSTLHRAGRDAGLVTLRFNFRGVGASTGVFDVGVGEQEDLLAVLGWVGERLSCRRLMLAGFSFGAFVAAMAWPRALAAGWLAGRLILVAPPVTRFPLAGHILPIDARVIYGDADEVVDPLAIASWLASQPNVLPVNVLSGAGHFFHGRLTELKNWVAVVLSEDGA